MCVRADKHTDRGAHSSMGGARFACNSRASPSSLVAASLPGMCTLEGLDPAASFSDGPPSQWSIEAQLEWVLNNTISSQSNCDFRSESTSAPGPELEELESDQPVEVETANTLEIFQQLEALQQKVTPDIPASFCHKNLPVSLHEKIVHSLHKRQKRRGR